MLPDWELMLLDWEELDAPCRLVPEPEEWLTWEYPVPGLNNTEPAEPPWAPLEPPEPPLEPLELEMKLLELLEPLWPLKLPEPPLPGRQGLLGEVIRVGSLQGSEKVAMLLAQVPGEESHG